MKHIFFTLAAICTMLSSNAQPNFRARLERIPSGSGNVTSYSVYLLLSGTSPFTSGNNRFIGTAQFPIAVTKTLAIPDGLTVTMDPTFLAMTQTTGGPATYSDVVNPVVATCHTANSGEHYFSVNLTAGSTVVRNIIPSGVEFKAFTVTFTGGNTPDPDSVKLLNVAYRLAPPSAGANNFQCQLAIEDNMANEYTDPFTPGSPLFYNKADLSNSESAGTTGSMFYGWMPGDYNACSKSLNPSLPKSATAVNSIAAITKEVVSVTSNPINENTKLHITASVDQHMDYTVVDASGKLVSRRSLEVHAGTGDYDFENLSSLASGTYYLTARGASINTTVKMTK